MPTRLVVPPSLRTRPFTVAEGLAAELTRDDLRSPALRSPFHGVRIAAELPETLQNRCAAARLVLPPDAAFARSTAAGLLDLPIPRRLERNPDVHVVIAPGTSVVRTRGIDMRSAANAETTLVRGLAVTRPATVWRDLAPQLTHDELIILGDSVARRQDGMAQLRQVTETSAGRRAVAAMRAALPHVRERVDSPQETRTRLLLVRVGIPEPECGQDVFGDDGLTWLACPDLIWREAKVALEYDGGTHRTDHKQWSDDRGRKELMDDYGWFVIVVTSEDLRIRRAALVRRVENRLRSRGLCW